MIRFYTLGSLDLKAPDGRQLKSVLAQPKRIALLAYLAACGKGESIRRDTLLGLFWPELDESRARHALNQSLYVLRRAIGPSVFVSTGDEEVALAPGAIWCDATAFVEAAESGRAEEALEHYRGDLLEGFFISEAPDFEKWLDTERGHLRAVAARAAWSLAEEHEAAGRPEAAADWARRAADFSLENEAAVRRLMGLLDRVGDRASAVRAYEAFAARLDQELGIAPSPETKELIAAIRTRESRPPADTREEAGGDASLGLGSAHAIAERPESALARPLPLTGAGKEIWEALDPETALAAGRSHTLPGDGEAGRPGTAADPQDDPVSGETGEPRPSVAVLPFVDLSGGEDREYFADGISEELISALAQVEGLRVAARTSSFQLKGTDLDVKAIGERLSVGSVLEGSVRMRDDRVRITVQLVNAGDGFQLWSQRYDRELKDIFSVQEEIAREIVERLRSELVAPIRQDEGARLLPRRTADLEAYTLYLKGRYLWNRRTAEGLRASIECFELAIALDPEFAQAYAGLADAYSLLGWYRYLPAAEACRRVMETAGKALELEARVPEALTSRAYAKFIYEWDFEGAEIEFQRAIESNPGYPTVHHWYGEYLMAMGRLEEANRSLRRAHDLDPLSLTVTVGLGWSHYFQGSYDRAIELYESVAAMDPEFVIIPWFLGPAYVQRARYDEAVGLYEDWLARRGDHPGLMALLAQAHALAGRQMEARAVHARLEATALRAPIFPDYRAVVHASLGEADDAFEWLERAFEERCWVLVFLRVDPTYAGLRSDPRFESLASRIGLSTPSALEHA